MGKASHGHRRGVDSRASATAFLGRIDVRGTTRTKEKMRIARGCGLDQGQTIRFALGDRQAIVMQADAAGKNGVAVYDEVMRCDGRCMILWLLSRFSFKF